MRTEEELDYDLPELPPWVDRIVAASENALLDPEPIAWDVEQLLPADDAPALLFGAPGAMKTWIALHLCDCVASGRPFLGKYPARQRPNVLFLNADAGAKTFRQRVRAVSADLRFDFVTIVESLTLTDLERVLERYAGAFVVVDCFANIYHPPQYGDQAESMRNFVQELRRIFELYNCGGAIIDHENRGVAGKGADYYGSAQKLATFRTAWRIEAGPEGENASIRLPTVSCRKIGEGAIFPKFTAQIDFAHLPRIAFTTASTIVGEDTAAKIMRWARSQRDPFSPRNATDQVDGRDASIRQTFAALVEAGELVASGSRSGHPTYRASTASQISDAVPIPNLVSEEGGRLRPDDCVPYK